MPPPFTWETDPKQIEYKIRPFLKNQSSFSVFSISRFLLFIRQDMPEQETKETVFFPSSNAPFTGRYLKMINVSPHCHLHGTGQRFENPFYLMMLILSFRFNIQIHTGGIT